MDHFSGGRKKNLIKSWKCQKFRSPCFLIGSTWLLVLDNDALTCNVVVNTHQIARSAGYGMSSIEERQPHIQLHVEHFITNVSAKPGLKAKVRQGLAR